MLHRVGDQDRLEEVLLLVLLLQLVDLDLADLEQLIVELVGLPALLPLLLLSLHRSPKGLHHLLVGSNHFFPILQPLKFKRIRIKLLTNLS